MDHPAGSSNMSSTSRRAGPTRPSPLSRLHSSPGASFQDKTRSGHYTYAQRQAGLLPESTSPTSPCFVHSHLERYSQLDDRLRAKLDHNVHHQESNRNGTEPDRLKQINTQGQAGNRAAAVFGYNSEGPSPRLSPHPANGQTDLGSQQDNNRNSVYAPSPSDVDDAEDGGSLTRQLAETATGVREMSKQLGRTKVRSNIQSVLIVTKARDNRLIKLTREVAVYLMRMKRQANGDRGMIVYVDAQLRTSKRFDAAGLRESNPEFFHPLYRRRGSSSASMSNMSGFVSDASGYASRGSAKKTGPAEEGQLRYWTSEMCSSQPHLFDMVVTLGGDGTVLFTSWLFQRIVPPVLPFALGSLGFLTNFDFADYAKTLDKAVDDGIRVNLRMRFTCTVYRAVTPEQAAVAACKKRKAIKSSGGDILLNQVDAEGWEALEGTKQHEDDQKPKSKGKKDKEIMCFSTRPVETFEVLNDLVVDRGPSPYVSLLELFGDDHHLTTVQADGLCVATPTGSTAYSLSAGGSLVHPGIPALLISPICPHTLSFRPMLLPDGMELRVCVPYNSRSTAWASFDGRGRVELKQGDHIKIAASKYPFPTICRDKQSTDWFNSISRTLRWNEREKQKSFVVVEEDRAKPVKEKTKQKSSNQEHKGTGQRERGSLKDQEAPLDESPRDDAARIAASKKEADMGATRMGDLQEDISKKQERFRSGRDEAKSAGPLDGGDNDDDDSLEEDDDEEDEEEDEEEEGFDIDDVSEEKTASSPSTSDKTPSQQPQPPLPNDTVIEQRPQYSTKRPSHLLTSLLSMTSQGSADGYEDPGLKSGVDTPDRFGAPYSHTGPSPKRNEAFAQSLDHGLNEALHEQQKRKMHASGRLSSYRQDNTADIHSSDVDSDQTDATRTDASTYQGRLKVHPPGQPGIDPLSTSPKTGMHQRARSRSRSRSRSMSRSKVGSSSRSRSRTDYMISAQMETPTDSEKDTEQEDMLRPSRSQRRRSSSGASDMKTPRSSSIMTRHRYHDPEPVAEENEEDDGDGEGSKTKAFAFYGEDESESGQSDVESVG